MLCRRRDCIKCMSIGGQRSVLELVLFARLELEIGVLGLVSGYEIINFSR